MKAKKTEPPQKDELRMPTEEFDRVMRRALAVAPPKDSAKHKPSHAEKAKPTVKR